jgi:hypothetical protein
MDTLSLPSIFAVRRLPDGRTLLLAPAAGFAAPPWRRILPSRRSSRRASPRAAQSARGLLGVADTVTTRSTARVVPLAGHR